MTTYTILNSNSGEIEQRGATVAEAAQALLGYDGHEWEIRKSETGHDLYVSRYSRSSTAFDGLHKSTIYSLDDDPANAEDDIFARVIRSGHWTRPEVMTDASYDAMRAEMN